MSPPTNGYGLMSLSARHAPPPQDEAFACMQAALAAGATHWNGGEFYGPPEHNSLTVLRAFYDAHPEAVSRVTLNIKGGMVPGTWRPDGSAANVRRSVEDCLRQLGPRGKIDMFECARRDPDTPLAESLGELARLVAEGKIGGVALSEVSAATIRQAAQITKISAVEIELSLTSTDALRNGVAQACKELDIPIYAYSPIGRGLLSGAVMSLADMDEDDRRRVMPRFQADNLQANVKLVTAVKQMADAKGCTPAQLALGWLHALSARDDMPTIIPIPGSSKPERVKENAVVVALTEAEMKELDAIVAQFPISGGRYPEAFSSLLNG